MPYDGRIIFFMEMLLFSNMLRELLQNLYFDRDHALMRSRVAPVDEDGFKISLDVQQFKPEELSVKVVDDFVIVEGKHDERTDEHGLVSRQFTRRYHLPDDVDKDSIHSTLSSDNVLQLVAPKKTAQKQTGINIPISTINRPSSPITSPKPPAEKKMKLDVGA